MRHCPYCGNVLVPRRIGGAPGQGCPLPTCGAWWNDKLMETMPEAAEPPDAMTG